MSANADSLPTRLRLGDVLIIDDKFEDVKDTFLKIASAGIPVIFWDPNSVEYPLVDHTRIVLLDINLSGSENVTDADYDLGAKYLAYLPGPFLLMFMSLSYTKGVSARLIQDAYQRINGKKIPGLVVDYGFDKIQTKTDLDSILSKFTKAVDDQKEFGVVLSAEATLVQGVNNVLSNMVREDFKNAILETLRLIEKDTDKKSLAREFIFFISRMISRNHEESPQFKELRRKLALLEFNSSSNVDGLNLALLNSQRMFYSPSKKETPWTGDIFVTNKKNSLQEYAILISPSCDISQNKIGYYKFCFGAVVTESDLKSNSDHPLYKMDEKLNKSAEKAISKYINHETTISPRFYVLNNFLEQTSDCSRSLVLDLQVVHSVYPASLKRSKWKRVVRLDSPFIEDLLQKYGAYSYRLGTPTTST